MRALTDARAGGQPAPGGHDRQARAPAAAGLPPPEPALARIGRAATAALYQELVLYPKPGLVSLVDSGSHADMTASTFLRSLAALRPYFVQAACLGALDAPFSRLERAGIDAEQRMLRATAGINTHRGAVFSLGLLCAAAGRLQTQPQPLPGSLTGPQPDPLATPARLRQQLLQAWGPALAERCARQRASNGQRAAQDHGLRSAGAEAALGLPVLFEVAVPALQQALAAGLAPRWARLQTLFCVMAVLDDTNLAHRGGLAGLRFGQRAAADFLAAGGVARPDALAHAVSLHQAFVARRLSPGGAADLLAAACWVQRVCTPQRPLPPVPGSDSGSDSGTDSGSAALAG